MSSKSIFFSILVILFFSLGATPSQDKDARFVSFSTQGANITFYWKDDKGTLLRSIQQLKLYVEGKNKQLTFAMNGGMYRKDNSPQGLFIENNVVVSPLDTASGGGNFYLKPNGVFYVTMDNHALISKTTDFVDNENVKFATQSGPMLLIDGEVHPAFKEGSKNLNIRNGVGILPDGNVIFAISKEEVNFYDFALFFQKMNCKNALYLDGFVSRAYIPSEKWSQLDGNFGVMIGVEEK